MVGGWVVEYNGRWVEEFSGWDLDSCGRLEEYNWVYVCRLIFKVWIIFKCLFC